jgi:hypothetical protein
LSNSQKAASPSKALVQRFLDTRRRVDDVESPFSTVFLHNCNSSLNGIDTIVSVHYKIRSRATQVGLARPQDLKFGEKRPIMEWYLIEFCKPNPLGASIFGAFQLILVAAVWVFKICLPKPVKTD